MSNLTPPEGFVTTAEREARLGQRGVTVWFTGLSGSGKSTLARALERRLFDDGRSVVVLDGDTVRTRLNEDLGFSARDRGENVRRFAHVARLFNDAGLIAVCSLISPTREARATARGIVGEDRFVLVHVSTPLEVCRARDPKSLYARADAGEIPEFTGVSSPYEEPESAQVTVDTSQHDLEACLEMVLQGAFSS